jgi:hypothetical protein
MRYVPSIAALLATSVLAGAAQAGAPSVTHVFPFPATDNIPGPEARSVLTRNATSIRIDLKTSGLDPQSPYTLWAVLFNHPEYCHTSPCSPADLPVSPGHDPRVEATIVFAGGGLADGAGHGDFRGRVLRSREGLALGERIAGVGVFDPRQAEIHVVVRAHGYPADPEDVFAAISSFAGGCVAANPCEDQQFAVHLAGAAY